jgi:hypothetical protein
MSRAAILAAEGDPYTLLFTVKLFKERWYDEVDALYIGYNNYSGVDEETIITIMRELIDEPKVTFIYHNDRVKHGPMCAELIRICKEDYVLFIETDSYIFQSGVVSKHFKSIESGKVDAVGSPRVSCSQEILDFSKEKYDLNYEGLGDKGPNFWPCFFFCKREDLLKTDLDFGGKDFKKGKHYKEIDYKFKDDCTGDTFVWASMQLRALGLSFKEVRQHKASPTEIEEKANGTMNWDGSDFDWIHAGSLSAGLSKLFKGKKIPKDPSDIEKQEMETRIAFWCIAFYSIDIGGCLRTKTMYRDGIDNLVKEMKLDEGRIQEKIQIYKELLRV